MKNPGIPRPRRSPDEAHEPTMDALAILTDVFTVKRHAISSIYEMAFAALDFSNSQFTRADVYRKLNTQYSGRSTLAGDGPKRAVEYLEQRGFVEQTDLERKGRGVKYLTAKYLKVGTPLVAFAQDYNTLHLELVQTCQGESAMPEEEITERSLRSFAASYDLSLYQVTAERLAAQTNMHPESVRYLAVDGWATHMRLAASVKTLRGQRIREMYESNLQREFSELVQTDSSL